jgi:uncharacterized ferritin-like protein (DUF455 family)
MNPQAPQFTPQVTPATPELRELALDALCEPDFERKVTLALVLHAQTAPSFIANADLESALRTLPGRPERPLLVHPAKVPRRSPLTLDGRAALIHAIAHIEFNAINLALDAVWRFDRMPEAFYLDWARVAREEAYHFTLLRDHLKSLRAPGDAASPAWNYGDFPAHDNLWAMCDETRHDVLARMALVPRTLEARGLDATPQIQAKLRQVGTADALRAVEILDIILRDEVGHVAIGNHWYHWLCARDGVDPVAHHALLARRHGAPRLKPPFNRAARLQAGFTDAEIEHLGCE